MGVSSTDNIFIDNVLPNDVIEFSFTNSAPPAGTPTVELTGLAGTGNPTPSSVTAPFGASPQSTYTVQPGDGTDVFFMLTIPPNITNPNPPPPNLQNPGRVNYTISCTQAPPSATLTLVKDVINNNGGTAVDTDFTLEFTGPINGSGTEGQAAITGASVTPGNYTLTESGAVVADYDLTAITCNGTDADGLAGGLDLAAGENVTCTFTNDDKATAGQTTLTLVKDVINDDGGTAVDTDFTLTFTGPSNGSGTEGQPDITGPSVTPGNYTLTETGPAGYDLTAITCNGADTDGLAGGLDLAQGEQVTCTFTNDDRKDDPGDEETKRFIHRRVDNLLTHGPDRARLLRRVQEQRPSLKDGPMKLAGTTLMSAPAGMTGSGGGALHLGAPETGVPWLDAVMGRPEEEPFGMVPLAATGPTSSSSALLSSIAGKLMPLMEGQTSFKFGTSLSEIRTNIAEAEARSQQKKLQDAGLSFEGQPYTNPFLGVREGLDFWIEGHITRYRDDIGGISREGDFRILYVGADYVLADGVLIGGLVQIDDTEEDIDDPTRTGEIDGTGWMVGPYFGARVLDNLFFDARAAWGQSENDIWIDDAGGFRTGSFDTERWLATATLTGVHYHGAWRFSPQIGVAYGHESYDTYVNSLGQTIAGSEANIGRLNGGGEIAYRIERSSGTIVEPMVSLTGIWNFDSDDLVINGVTEQTDETRAKVEGGVMIRTPAGWALRAAGMYDGLGSDDFEAYGGSLWVNIPIYKPD